MKEELDALKLKEHIKIGKINEFRKRKYAQLIVCIDKEDAAKLKEQLKADGLTYSKFVKDAIDEYMKGKN